MSTRIPLARFRVGDKVSVASTETGYEPFIGWIIGCEYRYDEIVYDVAETEDGRFSSGAWPEDALTEST